MPEANQDLDGFLPPGVVVKVAGKEFTVKPFVLRTRTSVLRLLSTIFTDLAKRDPKVLSTATNVSVVMMLVESAGESISEVYTQVLGVEKEWLMDNLTVQDEVNLLSAIFEVNDFDFLFKRVNDLIQGFQKKTVQQ